MRVALLLVMAILTGCAASVKTGGSTEALSIQDGSKDHLVVTFSGNQKVKANPEWGRFRAAWRDALLAEASAAGLQVKEQTGQPKPQQAPGTLMLVEVSNFRHLTSGQRYGLGVMTGNAWINSKVSFIDLQTGDVLGSRAYDTSSSAWEGVFSAMTDEQLQAISKEMIGEIVSARTAPRRQPAAPTPGQSGQLTKEQKIEQLGRENLGYEEHMKRYRAIMAEQP